MVEFKLYNVKNSGLWFDHPDIAYFLISRPGNYDNLLKQENPLEFFIHKIKNTKAIVDNSFTLVKDYIENTTNFKVLRQMNICEVKNFFEIREVIKGFPAFPLMLGFSSIENYKPKFEYLCWLFNDESLISKYYEALKIEKSSNNPNWYKSSNVATNNLDDQTINNSIIPEDLLDYIKNLHGEYITKSGSLTGLRGDILNFGYDITFILENKDYTPSQFGKQFRDHCPAFSYRVTFEYSDNCPEYFNYKLYKKNINIHKYMQKSEVDLYQYFNAFELIETESKFSTELFKHMKKEMDQLS